MQPEKNLVEEALIQMKQIEDVLSESAKGILSSTMREEIDELVKESLNEQDDMDSEDEDEMDMDMDSEDEDEMDIDMDSEDEDEMDIDMEDEMDFEDEDEMDMDFEDEDEDVIDMRGASTSEVLKIFKAMDSDDGIIISKDDDEINISDENSDSEYLIKLGEQVSKFGDFEDEDEMEMDFEDEDDMEMDFEDEDEMEIDFEDEDEMEMDFEDEDEMEMGFEDEMEMDGDYELEEDDTQDTINKLFENEEEVMYEIEMDEQMEDSEFDCSNFSTSEYLDENPNATIDEVFEYLKEMGCLTNSDDTLGENYNYLGEAKKGPKFKYKMPTKGFDEKKKEGPKRVGAGKPKFQYDTNAENIDGKMKKVTGKRKETKEASRTYGMGSKTGRGLRKGITPNRNLNLEGLKNQVVSLQEKNNEYKKSLNVFREKLNEVAVFNANLAYATRLFTEHSTTKKEKINILRRFDNVQSLQESKHLYATIKEELSKGIEPTINESVNRKITNVASTGSSANLIESKTYENPQFLRMKDLISKLG